MILTGTCWARFSACWRRLTRISIGLDPQDLGDRDAEGVGLHHRTDERLQVVDVRALGQAAQGFRAALSELHLTEDPGELLGERPAGVAGHLLNGGVEAEAGLHADRQQVDGIGQRASYLLGPVVGLLVEPEVRRDEPDQGAAGTQREVDERAGRDEQRVGDAAHGEHHGRHHLERDDPVDGQVPRVAGEVELVTDPLRLVGAGQPPTQPQCARLQRFEHAVGERDLEVLRQRRRIRRHLLEARDRPLETALGRGPHERDAHHHDRRGEEDDGKEQDHDQISTFTRRLIQKIPTHSQNVAPTSMIRPSALLKSGSM